MRLSSARARTPSGGKLEGSVVTEQVSLMAYRLKPALTPILTPSF
jgi:hypothetical protein